ncbi:hypothetical protein OTT_1842 [Orientia tsutsugamushi str. Ikeda]|uniref:GH18 domain-containing protein n=1 Tax=Orientia tsutsugamushi (strain Ikeda) TaxID=334380 RepID=B3CVA3_ORITI|nr:glycosyl hydrolase family 18 protein [Orientia tsutsugamushi]BAG41300.1 hypothetical protein OTT_1842 [Orientia tsutsugamushi str. Ikeda]
MKKIFYTTAKLDKRAIDNLHTYINHIDILAPQCYFLQGDGLISGKPDSAIVDAASKHSVPIMPLIINKDFNQEDFHAFLQDSEKQKLAIEQMIRLCQDNNYYGMQFDFENILASDKDQYTNFYKKTAQAFHESKLAISIAVIPKLYDDYTNKSAYQQWGFNNWCGVYDIKALAEASDFISLMTYDQHTRNTPAGPIAGLPWVEQLLSVSLKFIEPEKLSLGIPFYSGYWTNDIIKNNPVLLRKGLNYDQVKELISSKDISITWNNKQKVHYGVFMENFCNNYLFIEDYYSLKEKLNLVHKLNLHGFSAWRLGFEDTRFYNLLKNNVVDHKQSIVFPAILMLVLFILLFILLHIRPLWKLVKVVQNYKCQRSN